MNSESKTVEEYISQLPDERKAVVQKFREIINKNLPKGFEEGINYKMLGYYVPHSVYPDGYHCNPKLPLPFMSLASQKASVNFYHMGIYAKPELLNWFVAEYPKHCKRKLDMGKSCVRFKYLEEIPFDLIGELVRKTTVQNWIERYEATFKK